MNDQKKKKKWLEIEMSYSMRKFCIRIWIQHSPLIKLLVQLKLVYFELDDVPQSNMVDKIG